MSTATEPQFLTATGEIFDPVLDYFYWDGEKVRDTSGLRRVRGWMVDVNDREIVPLGELHSSRDAAIEAGQKATVRKIDRLKRLIETLEGEKSPKNRGLKYRLMAR